MDTPRRQALVTAFKLFDIVLMVLAFALATPPVLSDTAGTSFAQFFSLHIRINDFLIFLGLLIVWHLTFIAFGLYHSRRLQDQRSEVMGVVKATTLGTVFILAAALVFRVEMVTPLFLIVFWSISTTILITSRLTLRYLLKRVGARAQNLRLVLIVGTNPRAVDFARKVEATPEFGYRIVGFADEDWAGVGEFRKTGYPLVCDFERFADFLRHSVIDEVVMALPIRSCYFHASRIAALCEEQGITMRFPSNIFNLKMARSKAEDSEAGSLITLYTGTLEGWPLIIKRVFDFAVSLVVLLLLAPLFVIVGILIRLSSPGPIFFIQKRVGLNKRRFSLYKFRTMVPDAEAKLAEIEHLNEVTGPVFKIKDDPRLTPVGKFLRKTSIDELPQLINVLRGEMSLVGPRPMALRDYEGFDQDWQRRRFSVRPGITCLWQVNGRSSVPFQQWMELDMQYIDKWSLWLDLKILVRTIPAVLKGSGAH